MKLLLANNVGPRFAFCPTTFADLFNGTDIRSFKAFSNGAAPFKFAFSFIGDTSYLSKNEGIEATKVLLEKGSGGVEAG